MTDAGTPSLSIIIPTLNAVGILPLCLDSMGILPIISNNDVGISPINKKAVCKWKESLEIIVADGGSEDGTVEIAHNRDVAVLHGRSGRGTQLKHGAEAAQGDWLMFLHADTVLTDGWEDEVQAFITDRGNRQRAAVFRFALDDDNPQARRVERMVAWRCARMGLPYGDQGLLIHKNFYNALGGYKDFPLMEDVDLIRRIGRANIHMFDTKAVTSAVRYRWDGWWARPSRNVFCLFLYLCGLPPRWIAKLYG